MESIKKTNLSFFEERVRRIAIISDQGLWDLISSRVLRNGRPISKRTIVRTFEADSFDDLTPTQYRIWIASKDVVAEFEEQQSTYGTKNIEVDASTTNK